MPARGLLVPATVLALALAATGGGGGLDHGRAAGTPSLPAEPGPTATAAGWSLGTGTGTGTEAAPAALDGGHDDGEPATSTSAPTGPTPEVVTPPPAPGTAGTAAAAGAAGPAAATDAPAPATDDAVADIAVTQVAVTDVLATQAALEAEGGLPIAVCWAEDDRFAPPRPPGLADFAYLRGINVAGGEFEHTAAGLPGRIGVNYGFDSAETFATLRARGHRVVRLPFRWERIQHELGGPLSEPGITELRDAVARAASADLLVLLDMHNYGRYVRTDDVEVVLGAGLTAADLADVWSRLARELSDQPAVVGWGIMNEPHALPTLPVSYEPRRALATFDTTTESWRASGSGHTLEVGSFAGSTGPGALTLTSVLAASSGTFDSLVRLSSPSSLGGVDLPVGTWIEYEVHIPEGVPGRWRARGEIQDTAFRWVPSTTYTDVPQGAVVKVRHRVPDHLAGTAHKAIALQLEVDGSDGVTPSVVHVGHVSAGTLTGPGAVTTTWKQASQAAVDAIRATGDARAVFVAGDHWGGARQWEHKNGDPWIVDPMDAVVYEAHYYAAPDGSGTYPSYAEAEADAVRRGYGSLTARVEADIGDFTGWLARHSVRGFVGEVGWPRTGDTVAWNAVGQRIYELLDEAEVGATYWATGERWNPDYALNPYGFAPFTTHSPAEVIERHPSLAAPS